MESTFDIEATRIPESKQKQRIDMLQHNFTISSEQRIERMNYAGTTTCREATWENKR